MVNQYVIETEIAVLFLDILLCVYLRLIYSGAASSKRRYLHYCYAVTFSSIVDVLCAVVLPDHSGYSGEAKYFCAILWQCAANVVYFMWMRYIGTYGPDTPFRRKVRYVQVIALGTFFYFEFVSLFLGTNYYIIPGTAQLGRGDFWPLLTSQYVTAWSAWVWIDMFICRKGFTRGQWWALWANYAFCWQLQIFQAKYFPNITINFIILSVNIYVFFFLLETPAYSELEKTLERLSKAKSLAEEAREIAVKADEAKGEFLANMSHEIRTPLTTILGMDEVILKKYEDGPVYEYASDIRSAGNTLLHIINDILDFSKIESGQLELSPQNYDLWRVLKDVDNMIRIRAQQKGLEYIAQVDQTLPDELFGDRIRVHQIMVNILNNGVKYTKRGHVKFTLTGERGDDPSFIALHITVADTGIGIHAEDLPKLFQSFSRIDMKQNHNVEGTGLGLAITGRLIDMMGGSVDVDSTYGMGTTFHVVLPQRIVGTKTLREFEEEQSHAARKKQRVSFTAPDAHVLVVDDNEMNRVVLRSLMKDTKVQVDTAEGGPECLRKVAANHYDVILMDYMMPRMDGKETLQNMKRMEDCASADAKVIVCTANALVGVRAEMLAAGFDDFLSKPVNGKELEEMLARYIPKEKQREVAS